jgi:hypothetical protein
MNRELPLRVDRDGLLSEEQAQVITDFCADCEQDRDREPLWGVPDPVAIAARLMHLAKFTRGVPQIAVLIATGKPPYFTVSTRKAPER